MGVLRNFKTVIIVSISSGNSRASGMKKSATFKR